MKQLASCHQCNERRQRQKKAAESLGNLAAAILTVIFRVAGAFLFTGIIITSIAVHPRTDYAGLYAIFLAGGIVGAALLLMITVEVKKKS